MVEFITICHKGNNMFSITQNHNKQKETGDSTNLTSIKIILTIFSVWKGITYYIHEKQNNVHLRAKFSFLRWQLDVQNKKVPNHTETLVRNILFPNKRSASYWPNSTVSSLVWCGHSLPQGFHSVSEPALCNHLFDPVLLLQSSGNLMWNENFVTMLVVFFLLDSEE